MIEATQVLRKEHVVIRRAMDVLAAIADRVQGGGPIPGQAIETLMEFFRVYADSNHHGKEEGVLFPEIKAAGLTGDRGALSVLEEEHERERVLMAELSAAVGSLSEDPVSRERFAEAARTYAVFQHGHMQKENQVLFPVIEQFLSPQDDPRILEAYARFEEPAEGLAELRTVVDELADEFLG